MKAIKNNPYENPIWIMYECEHGKRWSAVKGGDYTHPEGEDCNYSGCTPGHKVKVKGETNDRSVACGWAIFKTPGQKGGDKG